MISIIIPCYNSGKYIERCLNSLLVQNNGNFEVIVINDGSKDNSAELVAQCIDNVPNFHLINQENGGVSVARNTGMEAAKGDYICYIDSDDYVSSDYIATIEKAIEQYPDVDIIQFETRGNEYRSSVWSKCIKKSLIDTYRIRFGVGCVLGQDMAFSEKLRLVTDKIAYVETHIYNYALTEQSATLNIDKRFKIYRSIDDLLNFIKDRKLSYDRAHVEHLVFTHGVIYPLLFLKENKVSSAEAAKYKAIVKEKMVEYDQYLSDEHKKTAVINRRVNALYVENSLRRFVKKLIHR